MSLRIRFKSFLKHPLRSNERSVEQVHETQRPQREYSVRSSRQSVERVQGSQKPEGEYSDLDPEYVSVHDGVLLSGVLCDACKNIFRTREYCHPDQASVLLAATTECFLCRCVAAMASQSD